MDRITLNFISCTEVMPVVEVECVTWTTTLHKRPKCDFQLELEAVYQPCNLVPCYRACEHNAAHRCGVHSRNTLCCRPSNVGALPRLPAVRRPGDHAGCRAAHPHGVGLRHQRVAAGGQGVADVLPVSPSHHRCVVCCKERNGAEQCGQCRCREWSHRYTGRMFGSRRQDAQQQHAVHVVT